MDVPVGVAVQHHKPDVDPLGQLGPQAREGLDEVLEGPEEVVHGGLKLCRPPLGVPKEAVDVHGGAGAIYARISGAKSWILRPWK